MDTYSIGSSISRLSESKLVELEHALKKEEMNLSPSTSGGYSNTGRKSDKWVSKVFKNDVGFENNKSKSSLTQKTTRKKTPVKPTAKLRVVNQANNKKVTKLQKTIGSLQMVNAQLSGDNKALQKKIDLLEKENAAFMKKLADEKEDSDRLECLLEESTTQTANLQEELEVHLLHNELQQPSKHIIDLARKIKDCAGDLQNASATIVEEVQNFNRRRGYAIFKQEKVPTKELDDLFETCGQRPLTFFPLLCKLVKGANYCMTHTLGGKKDSAERFDPEALKDIFDYCKDVLKEPYTVIRLKHSYGTFRSHDRFVTKESGGRSDIFEDDDGDLTLPFSDSDEF